jgi:hypothetical protein
LPGWHAQLDYVRHLKVTGSAVVLVRNGECRHNRHPQEHCGLGVLRCPLDLTVYIGGNLPHVFFTLLAAERKALSKDFYFY